MHPGPNGEGLLHRSRGTRQRHNAVEQRVGGPYAGGDIFQHPLYKLAGVAIAVEIVYRRSALQPGGMEEQQKLAKMLTLFQEMKKLATIPQGTPT